MEGGGGVGNGKYSNFLEKLRSYKDERIQTGWK